MDKYIQILCRQNPNMTLPCGNPECKTKHTFHTKDVLKDKTYEFTYTHCGKKTTVDTSNFTEKFIQQLKAMGVTVG